MRQRSTQTRQKNETDRNIDREWPADALDKTKRKIGSPASIKYNKDIVVINSTWLNDKVIDAATKTTGYWIGKLAITKGKMEFVTRKPEIKISKVVVNSKLSAAIFYGRNLN